MSTPGDHLELTVGAVAAGGGCVARAPDGRVVFVRHALPGERVRALVTAATKSFLRADAVEILEASPHRVEPACPYAGAGRCGGCDWQHVSLSEQRVLKADLVREQLQRVAGLELDLEVEAVPGDQDGLGWRTRVSYALDSGGRTGLHRHRSDTLERIERCLIATPDVTAAGVEHALWPGATSLEIAADGPAQVVALQTGARGGQRRTGPQQPSPVRAPDGVAAGLAVDRRAARGPHGLRHTVGGRRFEVAAGVFWQVHAGAAEALSAAVLDALDPQPGERAVDLYAGVGLYAALIGERVGPAGAVLAVEADPRACADAARNVDDLPQVKVRTTSVDAALLRKLPPTELVVLDPPRAGLGVPAARALADRRPRRLAYVSCDAATFSRDLRVLLDAGWLLERLRVLDLFPMTEHVELVATLVPPSG